MDYQGEVPITVTVYKNTHSQENVLEEKTQVNTRCFSGYVVEVKVTQGNGPIPRESQETAGALTYDFCSQSAHQYISRK